MIANFSFDTLPMRSLELTLSDSYCGEITLCRVGQVTVSECNELMVVLKSKLDASAEENVIIEEQTQQAFQEIAPVIGAFRRELGCYDERLIKFKFKKSNGRPENIIPGRIKKS